MRRKSKTGLLVFLLLAIGACSSNKDLTGSTEEPPIEIPKGDVQVAVYYFPNWGPVYSSEWSTVKAAQPQFEGHHTAQSPDVGICQRERP